MKGRRSTVVIVINNGASFRCTEYQRQRRLIATSLGRVAIGRSILIGNFIKASVIYIKHNAWPDGLKY